VTSSKARPSTAGPSLAIARAFVDARRAARPLAAFPGEPPATLEAGYEIQEHAIELRGGQIAGWKVGKIPDHLEARLGQSRVVGPIFADEVWAPDPARPTPTPVFVGGFAALEAEFVYELLEDAPTDKTLWTLAEAAALKGRMRIGAELAGSPLATINVLGPTVVAADFGNNHGLIAGPPLTAFGQAPDTSLVCETFIGGRSVGRGSAASIAGGPLESVRFLLAHAASRRRPLRAGCLISTGAATGIHDIVAGEDGRVSFGPHGDVRCHAVPALPAA
jgi:2-keto-4-pentenoate hydratase